MTLSQCRRCILLFKHAVVNCLRLENEGNSIKVAVSKSSAAELERLAVADGTFNVCVAAAGATYRGRNRLRPVCKMARNTAYPIGLHGK